MRISTAYQFDRYGTGISGAQERLVDAQTRAQSGRRIDKASDDPVGAGTVVRLNSIKASLTQYRKNATAAKATLGATESSLTDVATIASQASSLAVRGGNDTLDSAARKALASEVGELQRRLVDLGNATDPLGGYLFGGQNNAAPPFSATGGTLNYTGDGNPRQVELSADAVVPVSTPGQPLLTNLYERLDALRKGLADGTAATVSSEIENLRKSVQEINLERGAIGARLQTVSNVESQHLRREDELTARISDTEEVDMGEAIMDYRLAETAYEAALNVASQGFRLSLMDFIRG